MWNYHWCILSALLSVSISLCPKNAFNTDLISLTPRWSASISLSITWSWSSTPIRWIIAKFFRGRWSSSRCQLSLNSALKLFNKKVMKMVRLIFEIYGHLRRRSDISACRISNESSMPEAPFQTVTFSDCFYSDSKFHCNVFLNYDC